MRNLVTQMVGPVLILYQSESDPSDKEWDECMKLLTAALNKGLAIKVLVRTHGGAPTAIQRRRLKDTLADRPIPVAVISDNVKARFTSVAVALLNRGHRSFAESELEQAYAHLRLTSEEKNRAGEALKAMGLLLR